MAIKFLQLAKDYLKNLTVVNYIVIALLLGLSIFNFCTAVIPQIKESNREKNIENTFNIWWEETGIQSFKAVGLNPDEKLKHEEFEQYRERVLSESQTYIVEKRVEKMPAEFRTWWELNGGKEDFIQKTGRYPNEDDFRAELKKWIDSYTHKHLRYSLAFVPEDCNFANLFTSWILFPGALSFLIFAVLFYFAFFKLRPRFGLGVTLGIFLVAEILGGFIIKLFSSTSFFDHYASLRYMGGSLAIACMLGACCFNKNKQAVSNLTKYVSFVGIFIDIVVNCLCYSGLFTAVAIATPLMFGAGALAGIKIPERKKTKKELDAEAIKERILKSEKANQQDERRASNRKLITQGLYEAKEGRMDNAQRILGQAMSALLQEHPISIPDVNEYVKTLTAPTMFVEFECMQWLEWGEMAKNRNAMRAALVMFEKGIKRDLNPNMARHILYNIGEIRINQKIDVEEGAKYLEKVIQMNETDALALQAKKLLQTISK